MTNQSIKSPLIVYDGFCGMCQGFIKFIVKIDKKNSFYFTSRDSEVGLLVREKFNLKEVESILLYDGEKVYCYSNASLKIFSYLGNPYKFLAKLMVIPSSIRDFFYFIIAKLRYKIAGKKDECIIPPKELRDKFI